MKILYFSTLCSNKEFENLFKNTHARYNQQMQKYNLILGRGFAQIEHISITAISARPITMSTHLKKMFKKKYEIEKGVKYLYLPFLNIKIIKSIFILIGAIVNGIKLGTENKKDRSVIVCDVLNIPLSIASQIVGKLLKIPVVGVVTDVPGYYSSDEGKLNFMRKMVIKYHQNLIRKNDYFVFLSKYMNDVINKYDKPFSVIEGHVDSEMWNVDNLIHNKQQKIIVMYAGSVNKANGLHILTKAFIKANIDNAELHVYGSGSYMDELEILGKKFNNIKVFGSLPNSIVVAKEIEADLLVNPRPTKREFVKYSFPSKNMEYMVSGTPILTTKIPSMPEEYNDYVYFIEKESVEGLAESLREILVITKEDLHEKGIMAKEFVLREKNNKVQAMKIIKMVESNLDLGE